MRDMSARITQPLINNFNKFVYIFFFDRSKDYLLILSLKSFWNIILGTFKARENQNFILTTSYKCLCMFLITVRDICFSLIALN